MGRGLVQVGSGSGETLLEIAAVERLLADLFALPRGMNKDVLSNVDPHMGYRPARRDGEEDEVALLQPVPGHRRSRLVLIRHRPRQAEAVQLVDRPD